MKKASLLKRLKWYYPLEKIHTFFTLPILLIYIIFTQPIRDIVLLIYGLIMCCFILYQGQLYWKLKLQSLSGINFDQNYYLAFFRRSKKVNLIFIGLFPLFLLLQLFLNEWSLTKNSMLIYGVLANIFGVFEHINYYHTQLMIDNLEDLNYIIRNKSLKKASLAKDLRKNKI